MKKPKTTRTPRDIVSVDLGHGTQTLIEEIMIADPIGARKRGPIIKAALALGLPLLLEQVRGGK